MKLLKTTLCSTLLALSASAYAVDYEGSIGVTTDYVDRGITQSDEDSALQLTLDATGDNFYAGVFVSNVTEGEELDFVVGYRTVRNGIEYRAGITQYIYTDHDFSDNITELNLIASTDWKGADVAIQFDYSPDVGDHWTGNEIEFYGIDLAYSRTSEKLWGLEFHGNIGYSAYESKTDYDYVVFWQLGASKSFGDFAVAIDYHDTDNNEYTASERAVLSATYQF